MTYTGVSMAGLRAHVVAAGPRRRCASSTADPEEWFSIGRPKAQVDRLTAEATAGRLCAGCPVLDACLELALRYETSSPAYGVWGGLTPWQREDINRYRRRTTDAEGMAPLGGGGDLMQVNTTDESSLAGLPLELVDLAKTRPAPTADKAVRAWWLFQKAEVFERLATADRTATTTSEAARVASTRTYEAAMALTTELAAELDLHDRGSPESETSKLAVAEVVA